MSHSTGTGKSTITMQGTTESLIDAADAGLRLEAGSGDVTLISTSDAGDAIVTAGTATTSDTAGGALDFDSGSGNGTGTGGAINITAGDGGSTDTSVGGAIGITGGTSSATNGDGGNVTISGGAATGTGTAGKVLFPNVRTGVSANASGLISGTGELVDTVSLRMYKKDEVLINNEPDYDSHMILKLEPKFFTWKADGVRELGFIVEDVLEVSDVYIYRDSVTKEPRNVKDRAIIAGLVEVVKEQQKLLEKNTKDLYELKTQLKNNDII